MFLLTVIRYWCSTFIPITLNTIFLLSPEPIPNFAVSSSLFQELFVLCHDKTDILPKISHYLNTRLFFFLVHSMASFISEVRSFSKLCWLSEWHVVEMQKYIIKSSNRHTDYHYASCVCVRERPLNQGPVVMLTTMSSEDSDWPEPCSFTAHIVWITLWSNHCLIAVYTLLWCVCSLSPQVPTPSFPVVVKMGHAHAGMGKVRFMTH